MNALIRWSAHVEKTTAQKLAARKRMGERWEAARVNGAREWAERVLAVDAAWRRWSLDADLAERAT